MKTFEVYRLSPFHCRDELQFKLAFSLKRLIDAYPVEHFNVSSADAKRFFLRLRDGNVDGCDYVLHHLLICHLLDDRFGLAWEIMAHGAKREPRLSTEILDYSLADLGEDFAFYNHIFGLNDLPVRCLTLVSPSQAASARSREWLNQCFSVLAVGAPEAYAELEAFRPLLLLASKSESSTSGFGGYSSSLAWGTIVLSADKTHFAQLLIQLIHELAHQLLFALAVDVPLAYNDPGELFSSPVRQDPRPMDGLLHACFVSARVHEVLGQIQAGSSYAAMHSEDQGIIAATRSIAVDVVAASLPTIDASARLSALGERVVGACRQAIGLA
jgi:hypothetical protein